MADLESEQNSIREAPKHYGMDRSGGDLAESDASSSVDADFIERMRICADLAGSVNALARKAELSQSGIRRYFTGGDPTRRVLIAIAEAAGVNVLWLTTGEGAMQGSVEASHDPEPCLGLVSETLRLTLETVEEALLKSGRDMSPAKKVELVLAVYELYRGGEGRIEKAAVLRLVQSAS